MSTPHTKSSRQRLLVYGLTILPVVLLVANYLAGALCLIIFGQDPRQVELATYWYAWSHTIAGSKASDKVALAGAIGWFAAAIVPFLVLVNRRPSNPNVHGKARLANLAEVTGQGFLKGEGVVVGRMGRHLLRFPGSEFVMLSAPTRSGKGVSTVIPTLLSFEGSVVVLDIKGENYQLTAAYRAQALGHSVFYFNPFSENSHRWNPLSYVSKDPHLRGRDLMALAVILFPDDPKNPFFSHSSRNLFVGLALLVLETPELPATLGEILRQVSGKGQPLRIYLTEVIAQRLDAGLPLSGACRDALNRLLQATDETLQNIQSSFVAPLAIWSSPLVDKATSGDDFDLHALRRQKLSVYLHIPAGEVMQASLLLNLFFSQLINENVKTLPEQDASLRLPCLLLLDEFTAIGKVAILAKAVGFIAGYNLRLVLIIQDKAQLVATYGKEDAQNLLSNMGLVICFAPKQLEEAEQLSKMMGDHTVMVRSVQHANVGLLDSGKYGQTVTESEQKRAVMLPQELLAMPSDKALLIRRGMPVAQVDKVVYYKDPLFIQRLQSVRPKAGSAHPHQRGPATVPALPDALWDDYHRQVVRSDHYVQSLPHQNKLPTAIELMAESFFQQYLQSSNNDPPSN
jgi:type IV secretion system protein VirD4